MTKTSSVEVYSVILLCHGNEYLLLRRSPTKQFAPNQWTGIGGRVEASEYSDIYASALRELHEETGITPDVVSQFTLRRAIITNRLDKPLGVILYFTGLLREKILPRCAEGELAWIKPDQMDTLDIIETTRPTIADLISDMRQNPNGQNCVITGLAVFGVMDQFQHLLWGGTRDE